MSERVLAISAHCDDSEFGALGTLLKHKEAGDEFYFVYFTHVSRNLIGAEEVVRYFKAKSLFCGRRDQELDSYKLKELIKYIEDVVSEFHPTIVYCPFIGDLNRDHRIVAEATMVACRPYLPNAPKEVWMYSIPGSTELGPREFRADRTENIDWELKNKLIKEWYPNEMINGREVISEIERFERWPR